eukprot:CAMPEP_0178712502 /NCGR_PEP_ID=MMETSP0699-20121125/18918_1 /TAXON_ID=265572 /ORGANISM="Extubocellulus spinifer, Strain CCMP396" /LENGTH=252 /DNA_ID=CAMNT_0020361261 /DNA_START=179 /DNA_END=937 /DNA_ORIENTATION=+
MIRASFAVLFLATLLPSLATAFAPASAAVAAAASSTLSSIASSVSEVTLIGEVDYDKLASASKFPHTADTLIARAKSLLNPDILLGQKDDGECLADDFEFVAAVVGPIGKDEYLGALANFKLEESFDIEPNFFGFSVDPMQPNRVWFFNRQTATHTAKFLGAEPKEDARDNELILPPQCYHIDFDDDLKMKEFGFYTVDRRQGTTGGLGGAFAYMYGVGRPLPIPECQPYKRSFRFRLLSFVGGLAQKFSRK